MIYLEVIHSRDPLALGLYPFEFDQIAIGRSTKNDLIFLDPELPLRFLSIQFKGEQLVVQNFARSPFFFVNGKKVSGLLKIKMNDIIAFGENQIRIVDCAVSNKPTDLTSAYDEFNKKAPELRFALDFIEEIIIDLEKDSHV